MKRHCTYIIISSLLLCIGIIFFIRFDVPANGKNNISYASISSADKMIFVNEVCSKNTKVINGNGRTPDLIELYNAGDESVDLVDWALAVNDIRSNRASFKSIIIHPGQYIVVNCSSSSGDFFTHDINMKIDIPSSGSTIYLLNSENLIVDQIKVPKLENNISYSRAEDAGATWVMTEMTFGWANQEPPIIVPEPNFSNVSGFYEEAFYLDLFVEGDYEIYYTLDSSEPTLSSIHYTEPILVQNISDSQNVYLKKAGANSTDPVDKSLVVRAAVFDSSGNRSNIVTQTYFVGDLEHTAYGYLPVVSLTVDPNDLFDEEIGIFTNFDERRQERKAVFEYFDKNRNSVLKQKVGIRVRGASTRGGVQKSLTIFAREGYDGNRYFTTSLFDNVSVIRSVILRHREPAYFDGFLQSLVSDRKVGIQNQKLVKLFIDGEFWGIYALMEKYDEEYFSEHYGVHPDNVVSIKNSNIDVGESTDIRLYNELVNFIVNTDFSIDKNYDSLLEKIDIQSLVDLYVTQIYMSNIDFSFTKNVFIWRTRHPEDSLYGDGKWRWMLYDMDAALAANWGDVTGSYTFNSFTSNYPYAKSIYEDEVFNNLLASGRFQELFVSSFLFMTEHNFSPDRVIDKLHHDYVGNPKIETFFQKRSSYAIAQLDDYMKHWDTYYHDDRTGFAKEQSSSMSLGKIAWFSLIAVGCIFICLLLVDVIRNRRRS